MKDHELFSLLHIFLNDGLPQYKAWAQAHADALSKYGVYRLSLPVRPMGSLTDWMCTFQSLIAQSWSARFAS